MSHTYLSEEVSLIYEYDLENFREQIKIDVSSNSTRSIETTKKYLTSDNESPR